MISYIRGDILDCPKLTNMNIVEIECLVVMRYFLEVSSTLSDQKSLNEVSYFGGLNLLSQQSFQSSSATRRKGCVTCPNTLCCFLKHNIAGC